MDQRFLQKKFVVRRKVFTFVGAKFHIYDENGQLVLFSKLKGFKLKEDIRLFTGEDMREELIAIKARKAIDFSATYDVVDSKTGEKVGALRRRGMKSIVQDEWMILNAADQEIGKIQEDSMAMALLRRFLMSLIPQKFTVTVGGREVAHFSQNFNPFVLKLILDFSGDTQEVLDKRLGVAAAVLVCAIEGRQN